MALALCLLGTLAYAQDAPPPFQKSLDEFHRQQERTGAAIKAAESSMARYLLRRVEQIKSWRCEVKALEAREVAEAAEVARLTALLDCKREALTATRIDLAVTRERLKEAAPVAKTP